MNYTLFLCVMIGSANFLQAMHPDKKKKIKTSKPPIHAFLKVLKNEKEDHLFSTRAYPAMGIKNVIDFLKKEAKHSGISPLSAVSISCKDETISNLKNRDQVTKRDNRPLSHWIDQGTIVFLTSLKKPSKITSFCCTTTQ